MLSKVDAENETCHKSGRIQHPPDSRSLRHILAPAQERRDGDGEDADPHEGDDLGHAAIGDPLVPLGPDDAQEPLQGEDAEGHQGN